MSQSDEIGVYGDLSQKHSSDEAIVLILLNWLECDVLSQDHLAQRLRRFRTPGLVKLGRVDGMKTHADRTRFKPHLNRVGVDDPRDPAGKFRRFLMFDDRKH